MLRTKAVQGLGFLLAGSVAGVTLFVVGYNSLVVRTSGVFWETVGFYVSMVAFLASIPSPLGLFFFLGAGRQTRAGEQLVRAGGYVFTVVFVVGLGLLGVFVLQPLGIDTAVEAIAFLDGVSGFVWGGIAGAVATRRWILPRLGWVGQ